MNNERIDLTQFEGLTTPWDFHAKYLHIESAKVAVELIAELKRLYEREDALVGAIKELCDSEDSTGCSEDLTVVRLDPMLKLYELAYE